MCMRAVRNQFFFDVDDRREWEEDLSNRRPCSGRLREGCRTPYLKSRQAGHRGGAPHPLGRRWDGLWNVYAAEKSRSCHPPFAPVAGETTAAGSGRLGGVAAIPGGEWAPAASNGLDVDGVTCAM